MCGRYVICTAEEDDITAMVRDIRQTLATENRLQTESVPGKKTQAADLRTGEICPTHNAPVLLAQGVAAMRWGLPGFKNAGVIINARAETAYEKPLFRQAMQMRRCIIISHGFFEWRKIPGGMKEKLLFRLPEQKCLYMAGLYQTYANGACFAVLTTAANDAMRPIHDRMPVIVWPSECAAYIRDDKTARAIIARVPPALTYVDCEPRLY